LVKCALDSLMDILWLSQLCSLPESAVGGGGDRHRGGGRHCGGDGRDPTSTITSHNCDHSNSPDVASHASSGRTPAPFSANSAHYRMVSPLEALPIEMIENIVTRLELCDIGSLRLASGIIEIKASQGSFSALFKHKKVELTTMTLQDLVQVTGQGRWGCL